MPSCFCSSEVLLSRQFYSMFSYLAIVYTHYGRLMEVNYTRVTAGGFARTHHNINFDVGVTQFLRQS